MEPTRTFSKIVLALHMPESEVTRFLQWLGIRPESVPRLVTTWKYVAKPDVNRLIHFGRRGLKRVKADKLINQLIELGYRYQGCVIALKPGAYTKKEARAAQRAGRTHVKEGALDEHTPQPWKRCLAITFELAPSRLLGPEAALLAAILEPLIWQRGRTFALWNEEQVRSSLVELVGPGRGNPHSFTELHFKPPGMFVKRSVSPP